MWRVFTYVLLIQDTTYSQWTDSQMRDWLIEHGIIKSDAQLQRENLEKLLSDNYSNAKDTVWSSWSESAMREWLIEHGYLKTDAQKTREELVALMSDKYVPFPWYLCLEYSHLFQVQRLLCTDRRLPCLAGR